eukprot:gnl/MRDRNA2_/MRDRNA2_86009_c1_seq3.p1 gnl/MRDRNA2_/MRDRNA2_86009_c1~~gnl/MRDRNA2_/MRDRNA2_86009_c1_seq3.p1  ORF type:complete len:831 (+),score=138.17 gnl/MRDRNA2_/MRDRNA2_86009_c1_seq3:75-2567(+)
MPNTEHPFTPVTPECYELQDASGQQYFRRSNATQGEHELDQDRAANIKGNFGRHRIFTWVSTKWGEENVDLEDAHVAEAHGVPRQVLVKCIRHEITQEAACLRIPLSVLLLVSFALCLNCHDRTHELRGMEEAVQVDLHENAVFALSGNMAHKDINDAHYIADVFTWLRVGLAPLIFKKDKAWSELNPGIDTPLPEAKRTSYLQYNRVVGGVRLSQTRVDPVDCHNQELAATYDMLCSAHAPAGIDDLLVQPEYLEIMSLKEEFDLQLRRWFLLYEKPSDIEERLRQLEVTDWIDNSTIHVAVHFLSYNAHLNTLTNSGAHFFFARTGRLWKKIVHNCMFLDLYEQQWVIVFDAIFVMLVLGLIVIEISDLYKHFKHRRPGAGFEWLGQYLDWSNVVDLISILYTIMLLIMWQQITMKVNGLDREVLGVSTEETSGIPGFSALLDFEDRLNALMTNFKDAYDFQHTYRIVASLFPVILILRLFKAFSAQPRLALVTQTINLSVVDVSHFLVVFFTIFIAFVVMAIALFGREIEEFSTFDRAFNTCFLVLMGDFDYEAMFREARGLGSLWFWLFQIVLVLLMLNMLLAIIMDTYTEVKGKNNNTETLPEQVLAIFRRWQWIRSGVGLPLQAIDLKLAEIFGDVKDLKDVKIGYHFEQADIITITDFAKCIHGMEQGQAQRLVTQAVCKWRQDHSEPLSISEAGNVMTLIHRGLENQTLQMAQNHQQLVHGLHLDNQDETEGLKQADRLNRLESELKKTTATLESKLDNMEKTTNQKLETVEGKLDAVLVALQALAGPGPGPGADACLPDSIVDKQPVHLEADLQRFERKLD